MKSYQRIGTSILIALALVGIGVVVLRGRSKPVPLMAKEPVVATNSSPKFSVQATNAPAPAAHPPQTQHGQKVRFDPLQLMRDLLDLTDDQAKRVEPVLKEQWERISALRHDTSLPRRDRMARLKEIQQGTDAKIKPLLTAEQAEKWLKMRLGQGQAIQVQGQGPAKTNMFSSGPQAGKAQQGLPTWRSRIPQPQQTQPQPAQQGTSK
jgi:Spy/CpxP family protein refolding chaperone